MAGGSHIVSIGTGSEETRRDAEELVLTEAVVDHAEPEWDDGPTPESRPFLPILSIALAVASIFGWTGFFGWNNRATLLDGNIGANEAIALVRDWSLPVLLVCVVWLLVARTSRSESARFGNAAQRLNAEAARLETRLTAVNRELSLAREFIAAQSRDIEALGRVTVERISEHADHLAGLIRDNSARIETIGTVSVTALDNMEKLRGQLPVIASSAKDVTNNIANAGRAAHAQLEDMVHGFARLNEFGQASERQVDTVKARVEAAIGEFTRLTERLESFTAERFAALNERGEELRLQLDQHEIDALAAIRTRASALGEELEQTRSTLDAHEEESITSLRARLSAVRDEGAAIARAMRDGEAHALDAWRAQIERLANELNATIAQLDQADERANAALRERMTTLFAQVAHADEQLAARNQQQVAALQDWQAEAEARFGEAVTRLDRQLEDLNAQVIARRTDHEIHVSQLAESAEATAARLEGLTGRIREIADHGKATEQGLATALQALAERLQASRMALTGTDAAVAALTDASVRLLELIQASAKHTAQDLPDAIKIGEAKLFDFEQRADSLNARIAEAQEGGTLLAGQIETTHANLATTLADLDRLHQSLSDHDQRHSAALGSLRADLAEASSQSAALADQAGTALRQAIEELRSSARAAAADLKTMSGEAVDEVAAHLGDKSRTAIEHALQTRGAEATQMLEAAIARATTASGVAADHLREQLAAIDELAGNLEQRVAETRARAEGQVDDDFARRAALITETLNSSAIDITRAIDSEVTDTAWSSYLRGDRGIFTRRAVKLLDTGQAREVLQLYESDRTFRDHVAQYIHDFEAMLRELLSTRDGHALSVTLLSSDMGKLYVALAQAIQRLRD